MKREPSEWCASLTRTNNNDGQRRRVLGWLGWVKTSTKIQGSGLHKSHKLGAPPPPACNGGGRRLFGKEQWSLSTRPYSDPKPFGAPLLITHLGFQKGWCAGVIRSLFLHRTPAFDGCVGRWGSKNKHHNHMCIGRYWITSSDFKQLWHTQQWTQPGGLMSLVKESTNTHFW